MRRWIPLAWAALLFALPAPASATHTTAASRTLGGPRFLIVPLTGGRQEAVSTTALFHTLFNDFSSAGDGTTYVQTGDIPAMWLRDSSAQTIPYIRFQRFYPVLRARFAGVLARNVRNVLTDPYANAFTQSYSVWERKWEIDSLGWVASLAWRYWQETGDRTIFTTGLHRALRTIVSTYACEQHHATCSHYAYPDRVLTEYNHAGNTGMIWSAFRPSDDAVRYRYNIPQQAFAVVALHQIAALAFNGYRDMRLAAQAGEVAAGVDDGIVRYGRHYDFKHGWEYAYETDGEGHYLLMDDANVPDLLAMPFFGYTDASDPIYLNTRGFVLSERNPYYFRGRYAEGLGSPHTPRGWVWPLGIVTRGLTATTSAETAQAVTTLAETDSREFLIHESFDANAYWHYTRAEFGWGNAFYAELLFRSVAGFRAAPYVPPDGILRLDSPTQTPALTRPLEQLLNRLRLVSALGRLLAANRLH